MGKPLRKGEDLLNGRGWPVLGQTGSGVNDERQPVINRSRVSSNLGAGIDHFGRDDIRQRIMPVMRGWFAQYRLSGVSDIRYRWLYG
jgi:hypothetical protein